MGNYRVVIRVVAALLLLSLATSARGALIDLGDTTLDDDTGLEWLDLTLTAGQSYENALLNNPGWRYASNEEVTNLFWQIFDGFYPTNLDGYSNSEDPGGAYPDQLEDALLFYSLFGETHTYGTSMGMYIDENGLQRVLGVWQSRLFEPNGKTIVYGPDLREGHYVYHPGFVFPDFASFLVREAVVPIPSTVSFFAVALVLLLTTRRVR